MPASQFSFKQFTIIQEKSAMKVGTDGVLLGAWADVEGAEKVLDIGAGTGLIALMAAQRNSEAKIHAVEIDEASFREAFHNISTSKWGERMEIFHQSFENFALDHQQTYDHLICNPPYFKKGLASPDASRHQARNASSLAHDTLVINAIRVMKENAKLSIILPEKEGKEFIYEASYKGLFLTRQTNVRSKINKPVERLLLEFSNVYCLTEKSNLNIFEDNNEYSDMYKMLTKEFYLNF